MPYQKLVLFSSLILGVFTPIRPAFAFCNIVGTMETIGNGEFPVCKYFDGHGEGMANPECVRPGKIIKQKDGYLHVQCPTTMTLSNQEAAPDDSQSSACASFCDSTLPPDSTDEKTDPKLDVTVPSELSF